MDTGTHGRVANWSPDIVDPCDPGTDPRNGPFAGIPSAILFNLDTDGMVSELVVVRRNLPYSLAEVSFLTLASACRSALGWSMDYRSVPGPCVDLALSSLSTLSPCMPFFVFVPLPTKQRQVRRLGTQLLDIKSWRDSLMPLRAVGERIDPSQSRRLPVHPEARQQKRGPVMSSLKAPVCGNSASFSYHGNEEISVACLFVFGVPVVSNNTTSVRATNALVPGICSRFDFVYTHVPVSILPSSFSSLLQVNSEHISHSLPARQSHDSSGAIFDCTHQYRGLSPVENARLGPTTDPYSIKLSMCTVLPAVICMVLASPEEFKKVDIAASCYLVE